MSRRLGLPPGVRRLCMTQWEGTLPMLGEYLATPNGRSAYLVLGVMPRPKADGYHVDVEARPRSDLAEHGATVHWFQWNRR